MSKLEMSVSSTKKSVEMTDKELYEKFIKLNGKFELPKITRRKVSNEKITI